MAAWNPCVMSCRFVLGITVGILIRFLPYCSLGRAPLDSFFGYLDVLAKAEERDLRTPKIELPLMVEILHDLVNSKVYAKTIGFLVVNCMSQVAQVLYHWQYNNLPYPEFLGRPKLSVGVYAKLGYSYGT